MPKRRQVETVLNTRNKRRQWLCQFTGEPKPRWVSQRTARKYQTPETSFVLSSTGPRLRFPKDDPRVLQFNGNREFRMVTFKGFPGREAIPCALIRDVLPEAAEDPEVLRCSSLLPLQNDHLDSDSHPRATCFECSDPRNVQTVPIKG